MGSSTIQLQDVFDYVAGKGVPSPHIGQAAGYGPNLALRLATNVMNDLIAERFNWKWNRADAAPFYTNGYQQDYPQIGLTDVGWLEDCDVVDINNTSVPPPLGQATVRKQLSRAGQYVGNGPGGVRNQSLCWMYNRNLVFGVWPGASVTYYPLVGTNAPAQQNPVMSMVDKNGNLLIVTGFGTTGATAPFLPAASLEGATVMDGTVTWTCVSPDSQGFRIYPLPSAAGPTYQFLPHYQRKATAFTYDNGGFSQTLDPIPDDYSNVFFEGTEWQCKGASPNPADKKEFLEKYPLWLKALEGVRKQGDREADAYGMLPATSPVESVYGWTRNPQDPSQPY